VAFSPDGKTLASVTQSGGVELWRIPGGSTLKRLGGEGTARVTFSATGDKLAGASPDGTVRVWEVPEGTLLQTFKAAVPKTPEGSASAKPDSAPVALSPDGSLVATASSTAAVAIWRISGGRMRTLKGHTDTVYSIVFSPDGKTLATAGRDNVVKLWRKDTDQ
jgi:WD40 repeat protein